MSVANKAPSRDVVTTINADGSRFRVHPADTRGRFTFWRRWVGYLLIALFVLLPWIEIGGHPALLLDIGNRRFHLFGFTLAFQDTWLLFFFVSGLAFLLFYVTALWGRVWCGWTCPQTVYLEHVYRRVERWIDGDATARRRLDAAPWSPSKLTRRLLKHSLYLLLSFLITHVFLAYFIPLPRLWGMMTDAPLANWNAFLLVASGTLLLYGNFAWFREQLCIIVCPYGRFQSALIDSHTKNVVYDARRGDPPGKPREPEAGDCIDCRRCVQVCPTGIDIRQGLQLECIACTACIDACDAVMTRLKRPTGLIRYASEEELAGRPTRWIRFRTLFYTALLLLGAGVAGFALRSVEPVHLTVTRMSGAAFYVTEEAVRNQFQLRLVNKSDEPVSFEIYATAPEGQALQLAGDHHSILAGPLAEVPATLVVQVPRSDFSGDFPLVIHARPSSGGNPLSRSASFVGPDPKLLQP